MNQSLSVHSKLIIALDFNQERDVFALLDQVDPRTCAVKIGSELFTLFGGVLVKKIIAQGFNVFLDLKFHDIPNTVAAACTAAAELGVWMLNVHALGGVSMMKAAKTALLPFGEHRPLLIAVTLLTSFNQAEMTPIGMTMPLEEEVLRLAQLASQTELDGVVCSAWEAPAIKTHCGPNFLTITPGIRLHHNAVDDQARVVDIEQALMLGSDYWVVGRPITRAVNPKEVIEQFTRVRAL